MEDKKYRQISDIELKELGFNSDVSIETEDNIDHLRKYLPSMTVAECVIGFGGFQNSRQINYETNHKYLFNQRYYNQTYFIGDTRLLKPGDTQFRDIYKPYAGQDLTDKTILLWGTGGFGDLLMLQPCLMYLKNKYPSCKILFISNSYYHSIIKDWDFVDEVLHENPIPAELLEMSDYQAFFESALGIKSTREKNQYHIFSEWLGLNLPDEILRPKLYPDQICLSKSKTILANWGIDEKSFIIIQICSLSIIRTPDPLIWKKLIDKLTLKDHKIIITDQPSKAKFIDDFIDTLENKENVFNFAHYSFNISDTIALASLAKLALSTDSALIHIAAALDIKSFGIYGPFPGKLRLSTYKNCEWIDCNETCSPCFKHGYEPCSNSVNGYSSCFESLDIDLALNKIEKLLNLQ